MSKLLVAANCNLNAQNKRGDTALHYAALYGFHSLFGKFEVSIKFALMLGLSIADQGMPMDMADYLKRKGADDSLTNHAGRRAIEMEATLLR